MMPILTLNNLLQYDDSLFNGIALPDGVDPTLLVQQIILDYGQMRVLHPDWLVFRYQTTLWFAAHLQQLQHLWDDYTAEYETLYNKDAHYEETRTPDITHSRSGSTTVTENPGAVTTESGSTVNNVQGFNSSTFSGTTQQLPGRVVTASGKNTTTNVGSDSLHETGTETITRREYGNIGLTTAEQLLSGSIQLWTSFNFYQVAAKLFAVDTLIIIY